MRLLSLLLSGLLMLAAGPAHAAAETARQAAERDLQAIHALLVEAHPGQLDRGTAEGRAFADWLERGLAESRARLEQVESPEDQLALVRFYLAGFRDGHLQAWGKPAERPWRWAGFVAEWRPDGFTVARRAERWPVELPPPGARLLRCDGQAVAALIEREIAPFLDRRTELPGVQSELLSALTVDSPNAALLRRRDVRSCELRLPDGGEKSYALHWQADGDGLFRALARPRAQQGVEQIRPGVYWATVNDFQPDAAALVRYEAMLAALHRLPAQATVVLDARQNNGGNGQFGFRIAQALRGPAGQDRAAPAPAGLPYAEWRVSAFAAGVLDGRAAQMGALLPADDLSLRLVQDLQRRMQAALRSGEAWLRQVVPAAAATATAAAAQPARAVPFEGRIVLLTDSRCASSCLDFADEVLRLPRVIHAGHPTSGDTAYIDIGTYTLPSGLQMWLPLKVWRHRARGANQGHVPARLYPGDLADTPALQRWVLDEVLNWRGLVPGAEDQAHQRIGEQLVAAVDQPQLERPPLEQVDHAQRHAHPAQARRRAGEGAEGRRGLGADEGGQVEGHHQRAGEGQAEHPGHVGLADLGLVQPRLAQPGAGEQDGRIPHAADDEADQCRHRDGGIIQLGRVHLGALLARGRRPGGAARQAPS
nr:hypothetical protein [Chitinimonas koreensis]